MMAEIVLLKKEDKDFLGGRCHFVGLDQELSLEEWTASTPDDAASSDAREFGLLAHKRWRYYRDQALVVDSLSLLQERIRKDPKVEVGMMARVHAERCPEYSTLGVAFFRRTWANNLCIDFLAANPATSQRITGIGIGLLEFIVNVAEEVKAGSVWGETTNSSVGFYKRVFGREAFDDRFSLPRSRYRWFWKARLAAMRGQASAVPLLQTPHTAA